MLYFTAFFSLLYNSQWNVFFAGSKRLLHAFVKALLVKGILFLAASITSCTTQTPIRERDKKEIHKHF